MTATAPAPARGVPPVRGLAGVAILALGYLGVTEIRRCRDRARRLEDDNRRLAAENRRFQRMADQLVPTLIRATHRMADATQVIADVDAPQTGPTR